MDFQQNMGMQPNMGTQNPYNYGIGGNVPSPMNSPFGEQQTPMQPMMGSNGMSPMPSTPQIPEWTPQPPFQNIGMMKPQYARGGSVEGLPEMGEELSQYGRHGDTMLAHINPSEALMLRAMGGSGTINPHTGLPEYWGFFKNIGRIFKKAVAPVLGSIIGTMIAGPVGGAIGGSLGGSIGHPNQRVGPVAGGLGGFFGGPALTSGLGNLASGGGMSGLMGGLKSGFGQSTGMLGNGLSSLLGGGGGAAASAPFSTHAPTALSNALATKGGAGGGGLLSALGGGGNLLNTALLGTAVLGTMGRREKMQGPQSLAEAMNQGQPRWRPDQYPRELSPRNQRYRSLPEGYNPALEGEHQFFEEEPYRMSRGGYLDGATGGQDDTIEARLSDGEYVIPADIVSDAGDGNNRSGAQKFDALVKNMRTHKGRKGFPPKAKSLSSYMQTRTKH